MRVMLTPTSSTLPDHELRRAPFLSGTVLCDRYVVSTAAARGGQAWIYSAKDTRTNRRVVVKLLRQTQNPCFREVFFHEISIVHRLSGQNIPRCLGHGTFKGSPFFIMPEVPNYTIGDFTDAVESGKISSAVAKQLAKRIVLGLCTILGRVHARGVLHLDLKSDNLMLTNPNRLDDGLLVLDFGSSCIASSSGIARYLSYASMLSLGTKHFLAPEQIPSTKHYRELGSPADIYSLSFVLYDMLTFSYPYGACSQSDALRAHQFADAIPASAANPSIHPDISQVLAKAMRKDPNDRFQTMAEFAAAIREARFWQN